MTTPIWMASPPEAAGLTRLNGDEFGGGPRMPMVPGSWGDERPENVAE
ncbi:MAG: hypothetical protein J2P16_03260 [Mycobacterium sp.]|nr:hypothetical protein [Mycobacterium sp.]